LLVFGAVTAYVLFELKRMPFERYSYRGLDVIIALGDGFLRPEERIEFV